MKRWKPAVVVLAFVLIGCGSTRADGDTHPKSTSQAAGSGASGQTEESTAGPPDLRTVVIDASGGEKVELRVEIADGIYEQMRGLMYRKKLGEHRGMLFVYQDERELTFWMRNTYIPLSIAYIDSEGRITDILDMKPLDDRRPHYVSSEPVQYALEVNQGFFDEHGVKVGDHARLPD